MDESPESADGHGFSACLLFPWVGALLPTLGYVPQMQQSEGEEGEGRERPSWEPFVPRKSQRRGLSSELLGAISCLILASAPTFDLY